MGAKRIEIIGIDPGYQRIAMVHLSVNAGVKLAGYFFSSYTRVPESKDTKNERLKRIYLDVFGQICSVNPDVVAIERYKLMRKYLKSFETGHSAYVTIKLASVLSSVDVVEFDPREDVKGFFTGNRDATKDDIKNHVEKEIGITSEDFKDVREEDQEHLFDACAVAMCYVKKFVLEGTEE